MTHNVLGTYKPRDFLVKINKINKKLCVSFQVMNWDLRASLVE